MIVVREVANRSQLREFVRFPLNLYKNTTYYVPALHMDEMETFREEKNPAYAFCKVKLFLAYDEKERVVGRVGAIMNEKANAVWSAERMRFTRPDFIDDPRVSSALMEKVEAWAKECGCKEVHGPIGFCDLDKQGMLIEGFDLPGIILTVYNAPYYAAHMARLGYQKDVDWIEMRLPVPEKPMPNIERIAEHVKNNLGIHNAPIKRMKDVLPYIDQVFEVLDQAYQPLYGVIPLSKAQRDMYIRQFISLLNPDFVQILLDKDERVVGVGVAMPCLAKMSRRHKGRLFPLGWYSAIRAMKKNKVLTLMLVGIRPELQGKGLNALLLDQFTKRALQYGMEYAESGPILETNEKNQAQFRPFNPLVCRRRRCWIKALV